MIPTLQEWKDGTYVFWRTGRSTELKAVDTAIANYQALRNQANRDLVGVAWSNWKAAHTNAGKDLKNNKRNGKNLFALLEAEFNPASTELQTIGAISRWNLTLPALRPIGFVTPDDIASERIDKAIVDAQSVLQIVHARLVKGDPDTLNQVKIWFGDTPLNNIRDRFTQLAEKARNGFKSNDTPLEVRWSTEAGLSAATGFNQKWMTFGPQFFDDEATFSGTNLAGRPIAPQSHIEDMRAIASAFTAPGERKNKLEELEKWCKQPGATFRDCVAAQHKAYSFDYEDTDTMLAYAAPLGVRAEMTRDVARNAIQVNLAATKAEIAPLNQRYLDRMALKCTASGIIIHELTHMLFQTEDHLSPLSTAMKCYGPALCLDLAATYPNLAYSNADNYRLFAECCQM